jgi:hypothetical protein
MITTHMSSSMNRALQVRTADRLRASLEIDAISGLPVIDALSEVDQRELCDVGGGRLAAVAINLLWGAGTVFEEPLVQQVDGLAVREVARLVDDHVRRTDVLGVLGTDTLIVLAPGLDPLGGRILVDRLRLLLADRLVAVGGVQVELRVRVGAAFRSAASPSAWTPGTLAAEAGVHSSEALPLESAA